MTAIMLGPFGPHTPDGFFLVIAIIFIAWSGGLPFIPDTLTGLFVGSLLYLHPGWSILTGFVVGCAAGGCAFYWNYTVNDLVLLPNTVCTLAGCLTTLAILSGWRLWRGESGIASRKHHYNEL